MVSYLSLLAHTLGRPAGIFSTRPRHSAVASIIPQAESRSGLSSNSLHVLVYGAAPP